MGDVRAEHATQHVLPNSTFEVCAALSVVLLG
jgi:hypothetical protein